MLVVQNNGLGSDFFNACGGELLDIYQKGTITIDIDDLLADRQPWP